MVKAFKLFEPFEPLNLFKDKLFPASCLPDLQDNQPLIYISRLIGQ